MNEKKCVVVFLILELGNYFFFIAVGHRTPRRRFIYIAVPALVSFEELVCLEDVLFHSAPREN